MSQHIVFKTQWCYKCKADAVICPRCYNMTCNGTYGETGNCPVCPIAYNVMRLYDLGEFHIKKIKPKEPRTAITICRERRQRMS